MMPRKLLQSKSNKRENSAASSANMSSGQKNALLDFMEKKYKLLCENPETSAATAEKVWGHLATLLNGKPGARKDAFHWKKSWRGLVRYSTQVASEKAEYRKKTNELTAFFEDYVDGDADSDQYEYSTGIEEIDRVMNIVGWERAFSPADLDSSQDDEKENAPPSKMAKSGPAPAPAKSSASKSVVVKPTSIIDMGSDIYGPLQDLIAAVKENTKAIETHNDLLLLKESGQPAGDSGIQVLNLDELQFANLVNNLGEGANEQPEEVQFNAEGMEGSGMEDDDDPEYLPYID